jgi:hypothetical protein
MIMNNMKEHIGKSVLALTIVAICVVVSVVDLVGLAKYAPWLVVGALFYHLFFD